MFAQAPGCTHVHVCLTTKCPAILTALVHHDPQCLTLVQGLRTTALPAPGLGQSWGGAVPGPCRALSSSPGVYPLDARSTPTSQQHPCSPKAPSPPQLRHPRGLQTSPLNTLVENLLLKIKKIMFS